MSADRPRVADVMRTDLVTVGPETSLRDFLDLAEREGISGMPVVDGSGRTLGVVSLTDVVRAVQEEVELELAPGGAVERDPSAGDPGTSGAPAFFRAGSAVDARRCLGVRPGALSQQTTGAYTVGDIMTPAVFSLRPDTSLAEAARFLADAEIHRALVFREDRLAGLVTTFDILEALAEDERPWDAAGRG